jgi:DNA-binding CsgD family transcriptional regulator
VGKHRKKTTQTPRQPGTGLSTDDHLRVEQALRERVKELRCLYGLAEIIEQAGGDLALIMRGTAELLADSWQHVDVACARVSYEELKYSTADYVETSQRQTADIIVGGRKVGAVEVCYLAEMPVADEGPFLTEERALIDAVAERLGLTIEHIQAEEQRAKVEHNLRERVKELQCLYGFAKLVENSNRNIDQLMWGTAKLLPPSWQYPDVTCARVVYQGKAFKTAGFKKTPYKQIAPLLVSGKQTGTVEVYYIQKMPTMDEGPFLAEERALINAIAERLSRTIEYIVAEEELRKAHAELQVERKALQESNAALRTVLARIEDEKSSIKQAIVANVDKILMPILNALEGELRPEQKGFARLLRNNLEDIASPFVDELSRKAMALTPAEVRICSMIKKGLHTKEIANLRRVSVATVSRQRESIRKKLGLTGEGINLATFLQTFATGITRSGQRPLQPSALSRD